MLRNDVNLKKIGVALGVTKARVRQMLSSERISTKSHKALVELGFPAHLLPRAEDVSRGRPPKQQ